MSIAPTHITGHEVRKRSLLFLSWLLLVVWLFSRHVVWRDEIRAYSLALSGTNLSQMFRNIHGEGHPALWYLILRGAQDLVGSRDVLPGAALVIGIAAMAIFTFRAPFRLALIALVLFSLFGAYDYPIIARNYGLAALVMFLLAAVYGKVRSTASLGIFLAVLANTNVPSALLAAAFLLFRFAELLTGEERASAREWMMFLVNCALSLAGAVLCFVTVYPPLNGGAVSLNYGEIGPSSIAAALVDGDKGFSNLVLNARGWVPAALIWASCLVFVRRPPALIAALAALIGLKLFFFFVYPSGYRHEALFLVFMLALQWITCCKPPKPRAAMRGMEFVQAIGAVALALIIVAQSAELIKPLSLEVRAIPFSRSADAALLLQRPGLRRAIVVADPDVMLETLPYYVENPLWFLREQAFGKIFLKSRVDRRQITLDDILVDADRLHRTYKRPVVILLHADLQSGATPPRTSFYENSTILTRQGVKRFIASTRLLARLRPSITDEAYDVYVYGA